MGNTVADQLVGGRIAAGVSRIYGIVGDSLNPIVDAGREGLRAVGRVHEMSLLTR